MSTLLALRTRSFLAVVAGFIGSTGLRLPAAEPATPMAPFKVEAEFGIDGLRLQNSHAVLNQHLLDQHGVVQLQDASGLAPNLYSSNSDTRGFGDILALRGSANSIFFSSPAIALYVDDVPGGSVSSYPSSLLLLESLSVKAGPQGTDYGRNAPAGVIELRSRVPGAKHQGVLQLDRGSFNASSAAGAFDGPLGDRVGYSATVGFSERDGYVRNTFRQRTADDRRSFAGRAALFWRPDPTLQVRLSGLAENIDDDATRLSSLFSPDPFVVASDLDGVTQIDRRQFSVQARKKLTTGTLTATTAWQDFDLDPSTTDLDLSPLALASSRVAQGEEFWTQEVRFESIPTAGKTQWRAGLFYSDSTVDGNALREFVVPPSSFVPPGFIQSERTVFEIGQTSLAGYANLDHPLNARLTLKLGVRLEQARSELERTKTSANNFRFPTPPEPRLGDSQEHHHMSVSAGLVHMVSDSLSLQIRTSLAHKPAGFSGFTGSPRLARFDGERIWANEIGLTFGPPKGRVGGSVLAFWNAIDHYQLERTVPNSTDFVVINADAVTSRGIEAKFMFSPLERLWWDFQAGFTEATFDHHRDALGTSVDGKRVPFIPACTLRTGLTVDFSHGISAGVSYAAVGRTRFDERNTAMFSQKTYGVVNAQLRCRFDRYTLSVYGQNLLEEDYYQFINPEIFAGSPGAPRRVGVQVSYRY